MSLLERLIKSSAVTHPGGHSAQVYPFNFN
jgi:hypothetical protein